MSNSNRRDLPVLGLIIFIFSLTMLACSRGATVRSETGSSAFHERSLIHDGRNRSYLVHLPPHVDPEVPLPVVISYHGGGGNAQNQKDYSGLDATADVRGFIAVYPNGTGRFSDRLLTWNAGICCGYARNEQVDDVGFTLAVIEDLKSIFSVDVTRVYATGLSNGAMMAYRLAEEAPESIAAIA